MDVYCVHCERAMHKQGKRPTRAGRKQQYRCDMCGRVRTKESKDVVVVNQ